MCVRVCVCMCGVLERYVSIRGGRGPQLANTVLEGKTDGRRRGFLMNMSEPEVRWPLLNLSGVRRARGSTRTSNYIKPNRPG